MLQTSGPWLGTTFNPGLVTRAAIGNVTIATSVETATLVMTTNPNGFVCNFFGSFCQNGRMGASTGVYNCPGVLGSYDMTEVDANPICLRAGAVR